MSPLLKIRAERDQMSAIERRIADFILEEILSDGWDRDQNPHADYASVETIAVAGECHHVASTGRTPLADPFRETGFFTPAHLPGDIVDSLERLATQAIVAISPEVPVTGAFHTEIKLTTERPSLSLRLSELDKGSWVIFEAPGFTTAASGIQQNSLDALRKASETSYFKDKDALWVKVVSPDSGPLGLGGATTVQISR